MKISLDAGILYLQLWGGQRKNNIVDGSMNLPRRRTRTKWLYFLRVNRRIAIWAHPGIWAVGGILTKFSGWIVSETMTMTIIN